MSSRFGVLSPWRNLAAKSLTPYSELPVAPSDLGRSIVLLDDRQILVRGNVAGGSLALLRVGQEFAGKYGNKVDTISLPSAAADLEATLFDGGLVAIGREDGMISILRPRHGDSFPTTESQWKHPEANGPILVRWHPQTALLMTASPSSHLICIWKTSTAASSEPHLTITVEVGPKTGGKFVSDIAWCRDGSKVYAALADGTVKAYDPRRSSSQLLGSTPAPFGIPRPLRIATTTDYLVLSTLNSSRQRELRIFASDDLTRPLQTITLDTASHPLTLTVDYDRSLVFLGSRGDVTLRWIELDSNRRFPQGAFALPPRTMFGSSILLPPVGLDVMQAEIDRLYVLGSSGEVIPIRIEIPQRQLIDFHSHLYPDTAAGLQALDAQEWLDGRDEELIRVSMDPARRDEWFSLRSGHAGSTHSASAVPANPAPCETSIAIKQPEVSAGWTSATPPPVKEMQDISSSAVADAMTDTATNQSNLSSTLTAPTSETRLHLAPQTPSDPQAPPQYELRTTSRSSAATLAPKVDSPIEARKAALTSKVLGSPSTSTWSRATLNGNTPLLSAFSSVPAFDTSTSPSARSFAVTPLHLIYPLSGAGGRLAFHEITRRGRLPEAQAISWIETGSNIADFEAAIFDPRRVATIGEDGVRLWQMPSARSLKEDEALYKSDEGHSQTVINSPEMTLPLADLGRPSKVSFNPIASDILLLAGADGLAIADVSGAEVKVLATRTAGVIEAEWALDGSLIAFAGSDRKLVVWDPKNDVQGEVTAHDSPRPFKICWVDEEHLITVGHMAGSTREVKLFKLSGGADSLAVAERGRLALDTSPAILFPYYDADAQLIYLWSKGERSISVLQLSLNPPKPKFGAAPPLFKALPAFQHSTPQLGVSFLPKRYCNIKAVEIGLSYRMARSQEIQIVSWQVERKRKDFFQDDVFPPTRDVELPAISASEWWRDPSSVRPLTSLPHIDLLPSGMMPLSQAPPPVTATSSLAKVPTQRMMTAKEREDELMSNVFRKAKGREGEEEQEETAARKRAPDDDDWGDDD